LFYFTGANNPEKANPDLFAPIVDSKRLPEKVRKFFRFGVPERLKEQDEEIKLPVQKTNGVHADSNEIRNRDDSMLSRIEAKDSSVPLMNRGIESNA